MSAVADPAVRLGLGRAQLGNLYHEIDDERARATVDAAWDAGVRVFDTAPHYGLGLSERRPGGHHGRRRRGLTGAGAPQRGSRGRAAARLAVAGAAGGGAAVTLVDAHHHLWDVDGGYAWLPGSEHLPSYRRVLDTMRDLLRAAGRRAVLGGTAVACHRLGTGPDPAATGVQSPRRHAWH